MTTTTSALFTVLAFGFSSFVLDKTMFERGDVLPPAPKPQTPKETRNEID
jgi:hypothetical protein